MNTIPEYGFSHASSSPLGPVMLLVHVRFPSESAAEIMLICWPTDGEGAVFNGLTLGVSFSPQNSSRRRGKNSLRNSTLVVADISTSLFTYIFVPLSPKQFSRTVQN